MRLLSLSVSFIITYAPSVLVNKARRVVFSMDSKTVLNTVFSKAAKAGSSAKGSSKVERSKRHMHADAARISSVFRELKAKFKQARARLDFEPSKFQSELIDAEMHGRYALVEREKRKTGRAKGAADESGELFGQKA